MFLGLFFTILKIKIIAHAVVVRRISQKTMGGVRTMGSHNDYFKQSGVL